MHVKLEAMALCAGCRTHNCRGLSVRVKQGRLGQRRNALRGFGSYYQDYILFLSSLKLRMTRSHDIEDIHSEE